MKFLEEPLISGAGEHGVKEDKGSNGAKNSF
jgi:hypothetical protein